MERPNYFCDVPQLLGVRVDKNAKNELSRFDLSVLQMISCYVTAHLSSFDNATLCEALREVEEYNDGDGSKYDEDSVTLCLGKLMMQDCITVNYFISSNGNVVRKIYLTEKSKNFSKTVGSIAHFGSHDERFANAPSSAFSQMNIDPKIWFWEHRYWYLINWDEEDKIEIERRINDLESHTTDSMEYEECESRAISIKKKNLNSGRPILTYEVYKSEIDQSSPLKVRDVENLDEYTRYYFYKHGYRLPYEGDMNFRDCAFLCARNNEWDLCSYYIFLDNIRYSLSADEKSMDMLIPYYRDSDIIKLELQCEPNPYDPYDD